MSSPSLSGSSSQSSFSLMGSASSQDPSNFFGLTTPPSQLLSNVDPRFSSPFLPSAVSTSNTAASFFQLSQPSDLMHTVNSSPSSHLVENEPKIKNSIGDLTVDVASLALPVLKVVKETADAGKFLSDTSKLIEESQKPMEDVICKTAGAATKKLVEEGTAGVMVGGLPVVLAAAIAEPLLVVPVAAGLALLPDAYNNAQAVSESAGKEVEEVCHSLFSGKKD